MYTDHARIRMQQRGVPPLIVEWLLEYGAVAYDHHGARIRYFDKECRRRIRKAKGDLVLRRLHELFDAYAVIGEDGSIVTVGHKYRPVRND